MLNITGLLDVAKKYRQQIWDYLELFYCQYMQSLGQIQLDKTVTVKVQCNLNDQIVIKNFKIIMDCLKDLQSNHNDLSSKYSSLADKMTSLENNVDKNYNTKQSASQQTGPSAQSKSNEQVQVQGGQSQKSQQIQKLHNLIKQLTKRTDQNQKNIMDNIQDINLINKQINDIKELLGKERINGNGNDGSGKDGSGKEGSGKEGSGKDGLSYESISNINKQMLNNKEMINKTNEQLDKLRKQLANLKDKFKKFVDDHNTQIKSVLDNQDKNKGLDNGNQQGGSELSRAELNQLRQKIAILNKKTNGLEMLTDDLKNQTVSLGQGQQSLQNTCTELRKELQQLKQFLQNGSNSSSTGNQNALKGQGDQLKKLKDQILQLRLQIEQLKKDGQNNSKTSIDDVKNNKYERGTLTQGRFKDDALKDLTTRVQYLQKMLGSKNSIDDKDKLPLIKRNKVKEHRDTSFNQKSNKKDISQIKAELQAWINNYLTQLKSKDNFDDIELKLQEIKNVLNKKADQEGMRKGLSFLENKINQLYLFLTEPDGDDAMIVRKGFNCLSCSKKVQKLRGKIGPHINWNNMTATNYSPPKVGYSRHMGEGSGQREDDQQ